MRSRKFSFGLMTVAVVAVALGAATHAAAQTESVVFNFGLFSGTGYYTYAGVVRDSAGNFYGTTIGGGTHLQGTVYELSPNGSGGYVETILHNFQRFNSTDGWRPVADVVLDASGNIYGTTVAGGTHDAGMVFELTPAGGGQWTETVLHNFAVTDGAGAGALTMDAAGNLYGITGGGGRYAFGVVYELMRVNGGWVEKTLHDFNPHRGDGYYPQGGLTLDAQGNLYGTTSSCQCYNYNNDGIVFELKPAGGGEWTEEILHSFVNDGVQGFSLFAGVTFDSAGSLYGTTALGGTGTNNCPTGCGTIFRLTPQADGSWSQTTLHNFQNNTWDGAYPNGNLALDVAGNIYGTTAAGGAYTQGTVFKLTQTNGVWNQTIVHNFSGTFGRQTPDGSQPYAGVIFDPSGNMYGTTSTGGRVAGTVFEITP
jgi:uncharacterized repeat protein (TIGR03803 family)